jgi:hypothetical protein
MNFRKCDLIIIVFSLAVISWIGLTKTRYDVELIQLANSKFHGMPLTFGEYWAEGEMPVQVGYDRTIDLGHTSLNPFDYRAPSIHVIGKDDFGMPLIVDFTTRALTPEETSIIRSFNNGDLAGLIEYAVILGLDTAYLIGRLFINKRSGKKLISAPTKNN